MTSIVWFLLGLAAASVYFRKRRTKSTNESSTLNPPSSSQNEPAQVISPPQAKNFEETHKVKLECDGTKCSSNKFCSEAERLFCQNVILKVFEPWEFSAQHYTVAGGRVRRVDFAVLTSYGRKVAIECDDFTSHAKEISPADFADHLERQNALVRDHWIILRFPFIQCKNEPQKCIDYIASLFSENETRSAPVTVYREMVAPKNSGLKDTLRDLGVQWRGDDVYNTISKEGRKWKQNEYRRRFYPEALKIDERLPDGCSIQFSWVPCNKKGCNGMATLIMKEDEKYKNNPKVKNSFCSCDKCKGTFDFDLIAKRIRP